MSEKANEKKQQKRKDYRSNSSFPFFWRPISSETRDDSSESFWERSWTRDLSAGGAAFHLEEAQNLGVSIGSLLEFQLLIPKKPVFGIAKVKRLIEEGPSKEKLLAVEFSSLDPSDRDRIAGIVLNDGLVDGMERKHD